MSGSKREATFEDLETVAPHCVGEIVDGELSVSPRPALPHARAASRLAMLLGPPFDLGEGGPGGWLIMSEPELHLGKDALVPDLAGWRRENMPELPHTAAVTRAPDWACEVLSPSTEVLDREKKMRAYGREGVGYLWLIAPLLQTLEIYRLEGRRWTPRGQYEGGVTVHAEPFGVFPLKLAALWER